MQNIKNYIHNNYLEILSVISLIAIFIILVVFLGNSVGSVMVDFGREAYFPEEVLKGKILYKDILNLFGPLSYQINAIFYMIFGANLTTLRMAGIINSFITLSIVYVISRLFTTKGVAWINTVFIMVSCIFNLWFLNYIFSYSYAAVYALNAFLLSTLCLIIYLKTKNKVFVPLIWFFIGLSLTFKYDYLIYTIFVLFFTIYLIKTKKIDYKISLYSFISFLIVPVLSFSALFLQGLTINDFFNQLQIIKKYSESNSLTYFYKYFAGLYPSKQNFIITSRKFFESNLYFILLSGSIYYSLTLSKNILKHFPKFAISLLFPIIIFFTLNHFINTQQNCPLNLSWLPIFTFIIFCYILISNILNNKVKSNNNLYLILLFIALTASTKSFFLMRGYAYGILILPLLFIANSIFWVEYLPNQFKFLNKEAVKKAFVIFFSIFIIIILQESFNLDQNGYLLKSKKGSIYNSQLIKSNAIIAQKSIDYIEQNLNPNDSVWVIPEGNIINFLTGRPSSDIYYNITPPYIEAFGEKNIIDWLKNTPPDYIFLNDRNSIDYNQKYLCKDYGIEICNYIKANYSPVEKFSIKTDYMDVNGIYNNVIYKRKNNE